MRQIKFRGKPKGLQEWVYGSYVNKTENKHQIVTKENTFPFTIIPETVGQFTGLTDKNGKEIYEGDIVNVSYPRVEFEQQIESRIGVVRFLDTLPQFVIMGNKEPNSVLVSSFNNTGEEWEIIGNIHNTPELIK